MVSALSQSELIDLALGIGTQIKPKPLNELEKLQLTRYVFNPNFDLKLDDRMTEMESLIRNDDGEPILPRGRFGIVKTEYRPALVGGISDLNPPKMTKMPVYAGYIAQGLERAYASQGVQEVLECIGMNGKLVAEIQKIICPEIPDDNITWLDMMEPEITRGYIKFAKDKIADFAEKYDIANLFDLCGKIADRMHKCIKQNLKHTNDYVALEVGSLQQGRAGAPGCKVVLDAVDQKYFKLLGKTVPQEFLTFDPKDSQKDLANMISLGVGEAMKNMAQVQQGPAMDAANIAQIVAAATAQTLQAMGITGQAAKPEEPPKGNQPTQNNPTQNNKR